MRAIKTLADVVSWDLCTGCGACYASCTEGVVTLVNIESAGIRPAFREPGCGSCTKCLDICPGNGVDLRATTSPSTTNADHAYGAALEIWQGHAADPAICFHASSGGILTALSLYCLEQEHMEFVMHTGMNDERPWENQTVKSRSREELMARAGSRYAPASPCDGLKDIEGSTGPCVFIGKPCDVAAVSAMRETNPLLDQKLGMVLSFFCAGTPSTKGTLDLAQSFHILPQEIESLQYRGDGWPGRFRVKSRDGHTEHSLSYAESWGALTRYRPLRCNLCPDGLGRMADISCGDAWHETKAGENAGLSLVIVRTEKGRKILRGAIEAGYLLLSPAHSTQVFAAQANLLQRRRELFGRLFALRVFAIPSPQYKGFSLLHSWLQLSLGIKLKTILGTARRIIRRRLYARRPAISLMS